MDDGDDKNQFETEFVLRGFLILMVVAGLIILLVIALGHGIVGD
jgi:hypothetical protein